MVLNCYLNIIWITCGLLYVAFVNCQGANQTEPWYGQKCCSYSISQDCHLACLNATSQDYLLSCKSSNEQNFFNCIERQKNKASCCNKATRLYCKNTCESVFVSSILLSNELKDEIDKACTSNVVDCIKTFIPFISAENIRKRPYCCDMSMDPRCRSYCRHLLQNPIEPQKIIELLKAYGCSTTSRNDRLLHCFSTDSEKINSLVHPSSNFKIIGLDSAKLQCCSRAVSSYCQKLCTEMSFDKLNSVLTFEMTCVAKLTETEMLQCLADVVEPCELGCERLSYCVNFNNRPTKLFRSCNLQADRAASDFYDSLKSGTFLVNNIEFKLINIDECNPNIWKAFVCAFNFKPCQKLGSGATKICRSYCDKYLLPCIKENNLPKGVKADFLCKSIFADAGEQCISLEPYLDESKVVGESKHEASLSEITNPCIQNPCNVTEVCIANRSCQFRKDCQPYACVPGCRMGQVSYLVIPRNTYIKVTNTQNVHGMKCYTVCKCNETGELEDCKQVSCGNTDNCWQNGKKITHNTQSVVGCNVCFCYAGSITCTKKQCTASGRALQKVLPCSCPDHYVPVCGSNGKTYPSACLARCDLLLDNQFEFGACFDSDPCSPNSCSIDEKCIPRKRVCLSINHKSCKQYDCVDLNQHCSIDPISPVCDKDNIQHNNICWMLERSKSLAHYGKCMHQCRSYGSVCGYNGETYESECAAWAERVSVDYRGACVAVGVLDGLTSTRCNSIKCSPLPSEHCPLVYPPGGCCPICGAALRLYFSRKITDWIVETVREMQPVVVQTLAEKLREHVKVLECDVFAFLSVESDIIAVITTTVDHPTKLQIEACIKEAEKLEALIQKGSPILQIELPLSFIIGANMIEPINEAIRTMTISVPLLIVTALFLYKLR